MSLFWIVSDVIGEQEGCTHDGECPSKHACFAGECLNPCLVIDPCVTNAECEVKDELPARVMVCTCRPGFSGKGDVRCEKISMSTVTFHLSTTLIFSNYFLAIPVEIGCSSDYECPPTKACENRACVNPCRIRSPCSPRATCIPSDHKATCTCPPGMTGNPTRECHPCMFFQHKKIKKVLSLSMYFLQCNKESANPMMNVRISWHALIGIVRTHVKFHFLHVDMRLFVVSHHTDLFVYASKAGQETLTWNVSNVC